MRAYTILLSDIQSAVGRLFSGYTYAWRLPTFPRLSLTTLAPPRLSAAVGALHMIRLVTTLTIVSSGLFRL